MVSCARSAQWLSLIQVIKLNISVLPSATLYTEVGFSFVSTSLSSFPVSGIFLQISSSYALRRSVLQFSILPMFAVSSPPPASLFEHRSLISMATFLYSSHVLLFRMLLNCVSLLLSFLCRKWIINLARFISGKVEEVDQLITTCELSRQMQELLGNYIMMEEYFMREMVTKVRYSND